MIDHVWTVPCSHAVVDLYSNNVSLEHVVEQLTISAVPEAGRAVPIKLDIMTLWARSDFGIPAEGAYTLTLRSPVGDTVVGPISRAIDLSEYRRSRDRVALTGLPLGSPGRYVFEISFRLGSATEWRLAAAIPLEVIFRSPDDDENGDSGP